MLWMRAEDTIQLEAYLDTLCRLLAQQRGHQLTGAEISRQCPIPGVSSGCARAHKQAKALGAPYSGGQPATFVRVHAWPLRLRAHHLTHLRITAMYILARHSPELRHMTASYSASNQEAHLITSPQVGVHPLRIRASGCCRPHHARRAPPPSGFDSRSSPYGDDADLMHMPGAADCRRRCCATGSPPHSFTTSPSCSALATDTPRALSTWR